MTSSGVRLRTGLLLRAVLVLLVATSLGAETLTRVIYADDPVLRLPMSLVEKAYGSRVHVLPVEGYQPRRPKRLKGVVLHLDPEEDPKWVIGDRNPLVEFRQLKRVISRTYRIGNVEDKWHEYRFLKQLCPGIAPPRMELSTHYSDRPANAREAKEVRALVRQALAIRQLRAPALEEKLVRLECLRRHMHADIGRGIVKVRMLDHTEGRMPKTDDDWVGTYLNYLRWTKPKVEAAQKEVEGTTVSVQEKIVDLPHIEGRILGLLLDEPAQVVVQHMIKIEKEARTHVVEGKLLKGTTFLRFYPVGRYLSPDDVAGFEGALEEHLLSRLPRRLRKLSCTPDLAREEGTGKVYVLDFNSGIYSGYYYPEEDLITTNRLSERLSGVHPPLLKELDAILEAPLGRKKVSLIRAYLQRWARLMEGDVNESFWDRIFASYRRLLAEDPTAARYARILDDMRAAGLKTTTNYLQFIAEVQDTWPELALPAPTLASWAKQLDAWDEWVRVEVKGHHLVFRDLEEEEDEEEEAREAATGG